MKLTRSSLSQMNKQSSKVPEQRIVHIGLGAFHRAHQAWYTATSDPEQLWGILAFTGRSPEAAELLQAQDGLFTLIVRDSLGDSFQIVDSIVEAADGNDQDRFVEAITSSETSIVTLTITEAGYAFDVNGKVDPVNPSPTLKKLALALDTRRKANGLGLAIVCCDNMPSNGWLLKEAMQELFEPLGDEAAEWLRTKVSFVSTSIDRITPKTTEADIELVKAATGWDDSSPVVTEPFSDWVLEGEFPQGRPQWERAGAKFVKDIEPFENRKLWLLNGAHSILAYSGLLRGHSTVAEAINDTVCRDLVLAFWSEASRGLQSPGLDVANYQEKLLARFENARIAHRLEQIAMDGSTKLRVRVGAVALNELSTGHEPISCASAFSSWLAYILSGAVLNDSRSAQIEQLRAAEPDDLVEQLVGLVEPRLASNAQFMELIEEQLESIKKNEFGNRLPNESRKVNH